MVLDGMWKHIESKPPVAVSWGVVVLRLSDLRLRLHIYSTLQKTQHEIDVQPVAAPDAGVRGGGASLIRNCLLLGPYSRPMPRALC